MPKFLLTSRPYDQIRWEFQPSINDDPDIHLSGESDVEVEQISREVSLVVRRRVDDISDRRRLKPDERDFIHEKFAAIPNRMYLWVTLTLDFIQNIPLFTRGNVRRAIGHLPRTVDEAYNKILERGTDPKSAWRLLAIVAAATQPLSPEEVQTALVIREDLKEDRKTIAQIQLEDLEPPQRFKHTLRDLCGLLLVVVDTRVYFLHQTAREFLIPNQHYAASPDRSNLGWKFTLCEESSHRVLAEVCVKYILLEDYESVESRDRILHKYSARNWVTHFRNAHVPSGHFLVYMAKAICEPNPQKYKIWAKLAWCPPEVPHSMTVAAYYGLEGMIMQLLGAGVNVDPKYGENECSPLWYAAHRGDEAVVSLLLTAEADVNSENKDHCETPLHGASFGGHVKVATLLLEHSADVECCDSFGRRPLHRASEEGHVSVVRLLLEHNADIKCCDGNGRQPLHIASSLGHMSVVKILLDHNADLDCCDSIGCRPLHLASAIGKPSIVRLLLERAAACVDPKDDFGQTPLLLAVQSAANEIAKASLENGARVDARDGEGKTPLSLALTNTHFEVAKLLLDSKANPNAISDDDSTPLAEALRFCDGRLFDLLQDRGAAIDQTNKEQQTLLMEAAAEEADYADERVRLLLGPGATIDAKDDVGRTALSWAARNGWASRVRILLENGADADVTDRVGCTPLFLTCRGVVSIRISSDESDEEFETSSHNDEGFKTNDLADDTFIEDIHHPERITPETEHRIKRFSVEHEIEVEALENEHAEDEDAEDEDAEDEDAKMRYQTKRSWRVEIADMLINKGASIDVQDMEGHTPLWWANHNRNEALATLLRERASLKDCEKGTMVDSAANIQASDEKEANCSDTAGTRSE